MNSNHFNHAWPKSPESPQKIHEISDLIPRIFPVVDNLGCGGCTILRKAFYLVLMDKRYATLQTLANIVRDTPHPTQYLCTPREMILHSVFDWELIHTHLSLLATEGMIMMLQADTLQFSMTEKGLNKINAMAAPVEDKLKMTIRKETVNS